MRSSKFTISLLSFFCVTTLATASLCDFQKANGAVKCLFNNKGGGKLAVVISSDVDHSQEALDFIGSWDRFPPCSKLPSGAQESHFDREPLPALVLRLSCDWGLRACEFMVHNLTKAVQPHMHCFSELRSMMNIVMFRIETGSTVADCLEFGDGIFDTGFDDKYPCYNDTLAAAHRAKNLQDLFCPRTEQVAVRHLIGADCNFLHLPNSLLSSGFGAMMYIESDNAVLKPLWLKSLLALLLSDEHTWMVGGKPFEEMKIWDGLTLNGGITLLNLKNNVFMSILDEMQNPESSTCLTSFAVSGNPVSQFSCMRFRNVASFDLRIAATLRSFLSIATVHRDEIVRGVIRSSEHFRHAPPTVEVLDMRWHERAFPRCIFIHKLPQMLHQFSRWDLSCTSLSPSSLLNVAGCPVVKSLLAPPSQSLSNHPSVLTRCGLPSNVVIDLSRSKVHRSDTEWLSLLSPLQFQVTRKQGTEPAFQNLYWNHHEDGVYFSVCSDTPLFDSRDKFDSGTGWPSFTRPIDQAFVGELLDTSHGMNRIEVHSTVDGAHLGHVFEDGSIATGRRRYCINSASLRFVSRQEYNAWVADNTLRLQAPFLGERLGLLPSNEAIPPPLVLGNTHFIEMPSRYSKWRRQTASDANCTLTRDGLLCEYPRSSFSVFMHTCSASAVLSMISSTPCNIESHTSRMYTLLLPSFKDCPHSFSDLNLAPNTSCFSRSVIVSIPCASNQFACSARHLLSLRSSGETGPIPQFDYLIGLPNRMSFCSAWLDRLAFYVISSSEAVWWLGVSSISAFPRLFDDFFILKGGDLWLTDFLHQSHPEYAEGSFQAEEPASYLYRSFTADVAAITAHASSMVRPIPLVERSTHSDSSCDCNIVSACIVPNPKSR